MSAFRQDIAASSGAIIANTRMPAIMQAAILLALVLLKFILNLHKTTIQHPRPESFAFGTMAYRVAARLVRPGKVSGNCPVSELPIHFPDTFPGC